MPSPKHITEADLRVYYDDSRERIVLQPRDSREVAWVHWAYSDKTDISYLEWLTIWLDWIDNGDWLWSHWDDATEALLQIGYFLVPDSYKNYIREVETPAGVAVEVETRAYPDITLHEMTRDRAIHVNVAARPIGAAHRVHIGEAKLRLGENQHQLAYKLVDHICNQIEAGEFPLETGAVLALEELSPDDVEELVEEP